MSSLVNNQRLSGSWFFLVLALAFCGLYLFNISGWLIHDDEGTDLYEAWQLQLGHVPGVDFVAEQQPLFLSIGKTGMNLFDNDVLALRTIAALQVLGGAFFLGFVIYQIWQQYAAAIATGVILTSGLVFEQARLYRPDPMMFGWELFGLGFVLLAVRSGKRPYWFAAGFAYAIAILMKPFGIFPVVGLFFFFIFLFFTQKDRWKQIFLDGVIFSLPFLLVTLGISALLYRGSGFYYQEAFSYHLEMGQQQIFINRLINIGDRYILFFVINAVAAFILPLAFLNRRSKLGTVPMPYKALLLTQLLVPFTFIIISRPLHVRYFMFLVPTIAIFLAIEFEMMFGKILHQKAAAAGYLPLIILVIIVFSALSTFPRVAERVTRTENGTLQLAQFIDEHTLLSDIVVSDYAGLNFHAKRQSIYEASIIAGGQIGSGVITGSLLIEKIESTQAKLILVHVQGGDPPPHQLTHLIDFPVFEAYLADNYEMIRIFDRGGQQIEIYERK